MAEKTIKKKAKRAVKKKRQANNNRIEIKIVEFASGEFKPLFVKGPDVGKVVIGWASKTAANWRSLGIGPPYTTINGNVYYRLDILEKYFGGDEIETFNQG